MAIQYSASALDEYDRGILRLLTEDARRSYSDIGALVGLSAPSVHARVRRLEERGILRGYTTRLDPAALGFGIAALVAIRQASGFHWDELERVFGEMPEVEACHSVTGAHTYFLQVRVSDPPALEALLRAIASVPGVASTETMLILSTRLARQRIE
jgi:Lrp/AsnC family leucine-responsive transcriptional regulator